MDQRRSKMNTQIYEEACTWFVECRAGDLDDAARREFDCWLRKSPEHLSAYLEIAAIWNEGPLLDCGGKWSVSMLIEHARNAGDDNVVALTGAGMATSTILEEKASRTRSSQASAPASSQQASKRKSWFTGPHRPAIAASIAVLTVLAGALGVLELSPPVYATSLGEQRSIQFEDGSTVELNSRSKIRAKYTKEERGVELIAGQALFHVAHDATRPFIVAIGAMRVRAVGTQFDVYKKSNGTVVTVVEGRVAVTPTDPVFPREQTTEHPSDASISSFLLTAGEQVTVTGKIAQRTSNPNIAGATAWREREIVFESASLSDAADEFNRYNRRRIVIKDPALYGFHISGVFSSTDPDSLIKFLRQRPGIKVTLAGGEVRVERDPLSSTIPSS
jgi:transmembrane sensor